MISYRKINNITGWAIFAIATLVYMLTVEPTASWWDCGEYIATAFKLQVGHPPGAPLFQLLGRFFSLFAFGDVSKVALMINIMSALSSSFTILFLFWSISMLAKKIALQKGEMTEGKMYMILGSAAVGALAYTFSDSFWFSAVEGEVYAMSSFFTALVFWAILKWEEDGATRSSNRWLILIAYLMGLSVGVHLLNLLAIPAIAFVFYYKKFESTRKGFILTGIASLLILATIMYVIVPGIVSLSSSFELFFVNSIGLPFNSGTIIYFVVVISLLIYGINYTIRKKKHVLNTVILGFTFILIGYSSFFMLVVRANADTPINENSPKDAISLLSYLNREQYGEWPIFYGAYYNAPVISSEETGKDYIRDDKSGKYIVAKNKFKFVYDPRFTTIFPRIWSNREPEHAQKYEEYIKGEPIKVNDKTIIKPTFTDNLNYLVSYQIGHMYIRYFMWNFVGRQNDLESQGDSRMGNWISGIPFIDSLRIGSQKLLPDAFKNDATNKFYFLPLILGFFGIIYHVKRDSKDAWVVFLLFLMTGLAIVIFLNQYPHQPRERDYAYAGSFYAFAIWIGLGVMAIVEKTAVLIKNAKMNSLIVTALCLLLVPVIMASEGWDDHDRSGKYAAHDFASNYLNHCDKNAVLYTIGDNDTFPLWYAQEVEGVRTDVRTVNYMLSSGYWYVEQMQRKIYGADPLPMLLTKDKYQKGTNDFVPYVDVKLEEYQELSEVIRFIASDNERTKIMYGREKVNFFPTKKVKITVDSAACVDNGIVPRELAHLIVKEIKWEINSNTLYKNDLAFLDFLANNNWKRSVYFANPMVVKDVFNATDYIHQDGVVYKFMPIKAERPNPSLGGILVDKTYDKLMNGSKWGNLNKPGVTVDRESARNSGIVTNSFIRLTRELVIQNKIDMAIKLIDRYYEQFPMSKFPQDFSAYSFLDAYYLGGEFEKAKLLSQNLVNRLAQEFDYYTSLPNGVVIYDEAIKQSLGLIRGLSQIATQYKQADYAKEIEAVFEQRVNRL
ncbi:MAG: DUF2723 domain-containing protein [Bacteroidetes bacterium]|nr:DUF2723 domain-containing protein [Bacteroidota bacterium]